MTNKRRKFADKTRNKIMAATVKLFSNQGFSGTSMQAIADKAGVNQTLLYHHFKNKKTLWKMTKAYIYDHFIAVHTDIPPASEGLEKVLTLFIKQRFILYDNKMIAKMMLWQQLEPNQEGIMGSNAAASPDKWLPVLKQLQDEGKMRQDIHPGHILTWIASSVMGVVFANQSLFHNNQLEKEKYIDMLINEFIEILCVITETS